MVEGLLVSEATKTNPAHGAIISYRGLEEQSAQPGGHGFQGDLLQFLPVLDWIRTALRARLLPGARAIRFLDELALCFGLPEGIVFDNGSSNTSKADDLPPLSFPVCFLLSLSIGQDHGSPSSNDRGRLGPRGGGAWARF